MREILYIIITCVIILIKLELYEAMCNKKKENDKWGEGEKQCHTVSHPIYGC